MTYTPRERVLCALDHEEPDRVPLFIGTSGATTVLGPGYGALKSHLGIAGGPERWLSRAMQYTWLDEEVMVRLGSDGRPLVPRPAESSLQRESSAGGPEKGNCPDSCVSKNGTVPCDSDAKGSGAPSLVDDWGVTWRKAPNSLYFEIADSPLRNATLPDLDRYPWPNLTPPGRFAGLAEEARAIQAAGYATVVASGVTLFERACLLRGHDKLLMDLAAGTLPYFTRQSDQSDVEVLRMGRSCFG